MRKVHLVVRAIGDLCCLPDSMIPSGVHDCNRHLTTIGVSPSAPENSAKLTEDTPSLRTSGLADQAVDVIISTTLFAPVHCGLRVRSNLRRRVGPKQFSHFQEILAIDSSTR